MTFLKAKYCAVTTSIEAQPLEATKPNDTTENELGNRILNQRLELVGCQEAIVVPPAGADACDIHVGCHLMMQSMGDDAQQ